MGEHPYHSPLRDRQTAATRGEILRAAADILASEGIVDFSVRDVAAEARVSERTVYHHFPSRQALLDGLTDWVEEQLDDRGLRADPRDLDDVPRHVEAIYAAFDEIGTPVLAMARLAAAQGTRSAGHVHRTEAFRQRFADALDPLPDHEAQGAFALLRHLASATTWLSLHDELGLSGEEAGRAVRWALTTLLDELERSPR